MSLLWCDIPDRSLGLYDDSEAPMTEGLYAERRGNLVDDPDPNIGSSGKVFDLVGGTAAFPGIMRWVLPAPRGEVGMGCRVWLENVPLSFDSAPDFMSYRDAGNTEIFTFIVTSTGAIQALRGSRDSGTVVGTSAQDLIPAKSWRHVETEVIFSTTVGEARVWVEGVLVLELTGINTTSTGNDCAQVAFKNKPSNTTVYTTTYVKDLFIRDGLGTANNGQIGPCTVYYRPPTSDVSSGWTSTGASDFGVVDESPPNDTDYISADDTLPAPSIMEMDDLPGDVVAIRGIVTVARALKTDSGDGNLQVSLSPNGIDWDTGADNAVSTTESYYHDVSELSPDTGAAWTPTEFNSARIRLDRTT